MFDAIYFHIGLDKTGSKAIQFACCKNVISLDRAGFFYPLTPDTVWHAELASFFHQDPRTYDYNRAIGRSQKDLPIIQSEDRNFLRHLEQKIQQTDAKSMVLSYEGFSLVDSETLKRINLYLSGLCKQIKIILYCREPVSYASSAVSQRAISMMPLWDSVPIQAYKNICEKFITIFGVEHMIVRHFSPDNKDVRVDFFKQIGFDYSKFPDFSFPDLGQNRSLSAEAIMIAQSLRERCQQEQIPEAEFSWRYAPILKKIKGQPYQLSVAQISQVKIATKKHLDYLRQQFSINFTLSNDPSPEQPIFSPHVADSMADIICHPTEFTPPLVPEVKTEQELACKPFLGKLKYLKNIEKIATNQTFNLTVEIFNQSNFHWLAQGLNPSYLSYHWQEESGNMIVFEGLRTPFATLGLKANTSIIAGMQLIAPQTSGRYLLTLTLVKENICWFEENGFKAAEILLRIH